MIACFVSFIFVFVHFLSFFLLLLHFSLFIFKINAIHSQLLVLSLLPFFLSFLSIQYSLSISPPTPPPYPPPTTITITVHAPPTIFFLLFCILSFLSPMCSYDYRILHLLPPRPPPPLAPNSSFSIPLQPPFLSSAEAEEAIRKLSPQNSSTLLWLS